MVKFFPLTIANRNNSQKGVRYVNLRLLDLQRKARPLKKLRSLSHQKTVVSDLRSPNFQIQFRYTPNTMPIKDGLRRNEVNIPSVELYTEQDVRSSR